MSDVVMREAQEIDYPSIAEVASQAWLSAYEGIISVKDIELEVARDYCPSAFEHQRSLGHQYLVLVDNNKVMGFASYGPSDSFENAWNIEKLYLLPESKGRGFGALLLHEVRRRALINGVRTLSLKVNRKNSAVKFYEKHGFKIVRPVDTRMREDFVREDYLMRWVGDFS